MEDLNEAYYIRLKEFIQHLEQSWRNKDMTNQQALQLLEEKRGEIGFFLKSNKASSLKMKILGLSTKIHSFILDIQEIKKNIYILRTSKDKVIACADESLVKKCIERLGKENVKYSKMQVCQTEEDLEGVLLEDKLEEQLKNPRIVHLCTDKDCPLY